MRRGSFNSTFMKLSHQVIKDFRKAYQADFGEDITDAEAEEIGIRLLTLLKIIYKPIPTNEKDYQTSVNPYGSGR